MEYVKSRHHLGLLRTDGTTQVGFMLAKRNGVPQYKRYDAEPLSEQRAQGEPGYGWFPPGEELPIILDDFSGGLSQEIYSSSVPTKYFTAYNMDCRFGQPIAGLKAETLTKPTGTAPTITDSGVETWTDVSTLTNWTINAGTITREGTTIHGGTYSCELDTNTAADIYQNLATTQIQGRRFTLTAWVYVGLADDVRIYISDGVSTYYSGKNKTVNAWEQIKVIATLDIAATQLRIGAIRDSDAAAVYVDDFAISRATVGTTTCHCNYGGNEYLNFGGLLAKIQSSDGTIAGVYEFPSPITSLKVYTDGLLYVALESSGETIEDCEDVWNELVDADVTASLDTGDYKVGSGSNKFVLGAGIIAGDIIATEAIDLDDEKWGGYDGVSLWIKCSAATSLGNLKLLLDNTANCASPLETLSIPALTANVWTKVYLDLASPSNTEAIISVGLEDDSGIINATIHIDQIQGEHRYYSIGTSGNAVKAGAGDVGEDGYVKFFEMNGTTMWKSLLPNLVYSCTNPADPTTWTTATTVDSSENDITALVSRANLLYVLKEDRPFYLTAAGAVTVLADDTKSIQTSDSGKNSTTWQGDLFMPYGTASLLKYDGTDTSWIDPALYCTNLGDFDGQVQGLAGDDQFLYAVVDNSTKVEVLAGESGWKWHGSLCEITLTGCETAFVSSVFKKRLYITSTVASESLYYANLYANYGDVTNDDNRNFPNNAELHTPKLHGGFKGDTKAFIKVSAELGHTYDVDIYFECHYQIQGDTTWTDAGDFKGTTTNRRATLFIPADSSSNNPKSEWIRFKLIEKTDDVTKTPILVNLDVRAILYVTKRRLIECVIRGCDKPNGDSITAAMIKTVLIEADNATWPVTFYPWGWLSSADTVYVNFLSCQEIVEMDEESRQPESHWYLRLQEVALS